MWRVGQLATFAVLAVASAASDVRSPGAAAADATFRNPQRVTIRGYNGDAMEPFLTRDGRFLLFNSRNDPATNTDLHYARARDAVNFEYAGLLAGANSEALDAVPTVDRNGTLFFVSTRTYTTSLSTIHRATFADGKVIDVKVVEGLPRTPGVLLFDVEVTADGSTLYYSRGRFRGGPVPSSADLGIAIRRETRFEPSPTSAEVLRAVNTPTSLEYAAALADGERELFFTRASTGEYPAIYRSERAEPTAPFGRPTRIPAITGFAEAPSLAPDGNHLYYHALVGRRFGIFVVTRSSHQ